MLTLDKVVVAAFSRSFEKLAQAKPPKVNKTALHRAKTFNLPEEESHSLRRAIERSQKPEKKVLRGTEPVYAGGNTAANMRGVIRSEEKQSRELLKKRFGPHSRTRMSSFYGRG